MRAIYPSHLWRHNIPTFTRKQRQWPSRRLGWQRADTLTIFGSVLVASNIADEGFEFRKQGVLAS
jgi:hypothetical protein